MMCDYEVLSFFNNKGLKIKYHIKGLVKSALTCQVSFSKSL